MVLIAVFIALQRTMQMVVTPAQWMGLESAIPVGMACIVRFIVKIQAPAIAFKMEQKYALRIGTDPTVIDIAYRINLGRQDIIAT